MKGGERGHFFKLDEQSYFIINRNQCSEYIQHIEHMPNTATIILFFFMFFGNHREIRNLNSRSEKMEECKTISE